MVNSFNQRVILDQYTDLNGVHLRLKQSGGITSTYQVRIREYIEATPQDGKQIIEFNIWADDAGNDGFGPNFNETTLGTSFKVIKYASSEGPVRLIAGTYIAQSNVSVLSAGFISISNGVPKTQHNGLAKGNSYIAGRSGWMRILHRHDAPIQIEADRLNGSAIADFDKLITTLQTARIPYVDRDGDFTIGQYHIIGQLKNNTTGDTIDVDFWTESAGSLVIDTEKRTVIYTNGNHVVSVPGAITPSNLEDWLPLASGANNMQYLEPVANIDIRHQHRGRKL